MREFLTTHFLLTVKLIVEMYAQAKWILIVVLDADHNLRASRDALVFLNVQILCLQSRIEQNIEELVVADT